MARIPLAGAFALALTLACHGSGPATETGDTAQDPQAAAESAGTSAVTAAPECPPPGPLVIMHCEGPGLVAPDPEGPGLESSDPADAALTLVRARFEQLPGWSDDSHADAISAFLASCARLDELDDSQLIGTGPYSGKARHWRRACKLAGELTAGDHEAARNFFEKQFKPYAAYGSEGPDGKMTGYYVQSLRASREKVGAYRFPIFARPPDLLEIRLSDFIDDGRSRRIWGRSDPETGEVSPYFKRAEFRARYSDEQAALLWLDSPVDAMAVEIEGSGKAILEDGTELWVAFAGKNGRRTVSRSGVMQALRAYEDSKGERTWSDADTRRFHEILDLKESMVFFEIESRAGAIGTQDVVLTPQRSLAVDRSLIALSTPIWIDTQAPDEPDGKRGDWRRLLIAQDTGGAIRGPVRGDIYWGHDDDAIAMGRRVSSSGRMWLLLPRGLEVKSLRKPPAPE